MQNRLREFREENNLSQQKMADKMSKLGYKISKATISMYESGDRIPTETKWKELANFFNTSVDTLKGKISNTDEVISELINIIHTAFFSQLDTALKNEIYLYLNLTGQINVPYAFYKDENQFKLNKYIYDFWLSCFDFILKDKSFISSLIKETDESRLKLILQDKIHQFNQKIINKNPNTKFLSKFKEENDRLINYLLSNYPTLSFTDNLEDILDIDKVKVIDPTGKDVSNENTIATIDNQIAKFKLIKNSLLNQKNDKQ